MSNRIYKFTLQAGMQELPMPEGAVLLDVQMQGESAQLWAICNADAKKVNRMICCYPTGVDLPSVIGDYIATFQLCGGSLVFHAFDLGQGG